MNGATIDHDATLCYMHSRCAFTLCFGGLQVGCFAPINDGATCSAGNARILRFWRCLPNYYFGNLCNSILLFFRTRRNKQGTAVFRWNGSPVNVANNNKPDCTHKQPFWDMKNILIVFFFVLLLGNNTVTEPQTTRTDTETVKKDSVFTTSMQTAQQRKKDTTVSEFELFLNGLLGQELKQPK